MRWIRWHFLDGATASYPSRRIHPSRGNFAHFLCRGHSDEAFKELEFHKIGKLKNDDSIFNKQEINEIHSKVAILLKDKVCKENGYHAEIRFFAGRKVIKIGFHYCFVG